MGRIVYRNDTLLPLVKLALPVIATSFMSIAYNFINILFVGRLGSDAVAAVGSAGFFMNLSWGISSLVTVGAGIKVSHATGQKNLLLARGYIKSGLLTAILSSCLLYILLFSFRHFLIGTVGLNHFQLEQKAASYLLIVGLSIPFSWQNLFFSNVFIGYGDSKTPFRINSIAFIINILLDMIFIFEMKWGINGAALGTLSSQIMATLLFYRKIFKTTELYPANVPYSKILLKQIVSLGISPSIQRVSFTLIAIGMARIISDWGPTAIAVQKIGVQIEAISYMTAGGFMAALSSMSGKAYGARNFEMQWKIFRSGIALATMIGTAASLILLCFPERLFSIFLSDNESLEMGREYLTILGFSQLFMCLEMISTGAFFGWGKTYIPALSSISLTLLRIPMAIGFIHGWENSLNSVWWSISISSIAKGSILLILFIILFKSFIRKNQLFTV